MPDDIADAVDESSPVPPVPADADDVTTEAYETDDGMVFYDPERPLAWVSSDTVLTLTEMD